jgi:thioesterase domain-containing protein
MAPYIGQFLKTKLPSLKKNIDLVSRLINVRIYNAQMGYRPAGKINSPVIVFRAEKTQWKKLDQTLGWASYANNVLLYKVPGDHHDMVYRANAKIIARYLNERITETVTEFSEEPALPVAELQQ